MYHNIYILQATNRSKEIFISMEGQRGIYIIKFPHFTLIIQEKDLGRQGNHEEAVFDRFQPEAIYFISSRFIASG